MLGLSLPHSSESCPAISFRSLSGSCCCLMTRGSTQTLGKTLLSSCVISSLSFLITEDPDLTPKVRDLQQGTGD